MDPFTLGVILRQLLASAGLKATILIAVLAAVGYGAMKSIKAVSGFFAQLIANRDQMLAQTMQRMAEQDARRAQYERETAAILATISTKVDSTSDLLRDTKKEMHERFNSF